MLYLLKIGTWICFTMGCYQVLVGYWNLPSRKARKTIKSYSKQARKVQEMDVFIQTLAGKISSYVKINPYKRKRMETDLKAMDMQLTPELFTATSIAKAGTVMLCIVPCLFLCPIASLGVMVVALIVYNQDDLKLKKELRRKRESIEYELPRFACTLKQEITSTRDVLSILERYKKNAGNALQKELEVTIADMRSGSYESALLRLESRVSSPVLSDIIRGLLGTLRGDDNEAYFTMLSHDLDELEIQRLKGEAAKQPDKITKYSFSLLVSAIMMYLVILGVYAFQSAKGI